MRDTIIVHHTAGSDDEDHLDFDNVLDFHVNDRNFRDIGYNFLCEMADGIPLIVVGRPITIQGAHAHGWNNRAVGVCFAGNFSLTEPPKDLLETAAYRIVAPLCTILKIPLDRIIGHRDTKATECPGKNFDLALFRAMVQRHL